MEEDQLEKKPTPFRSFTVFVVSFLAGYMIFALVFTSPGLLEAFLLRPISNGVSTEQQIPQGQTGEPRYFPVTSSDLGPIGAMNHQYLQGHTFTRIVIEVDHIEGAEPSEDALNALRGTVERYADKPDGVVLERSDTIPQALNSYSLSDIQLLMRQHRDNYSRSNTVVMYILYLNGGFESLKNTLGLIIDSSSFVIFPNEIGRSPGTVVFGRSVFEEAVITHEFGHMLGLVEVNYKSEVERQDPVHEHHSINRESVMYWAVEDFTFDNIIRGGPSTVFDEADRFDIEQIKAGIY